MSHWKLNWWRDKIRFKCIYWGKKIGQNVHWISSDILHKMMFYGFCLDFLVVILEKDCLLCIWIICAGHTAKMPSIYLLSISGLIVTCVVIWTETILPVENMNESLMAWSNEFGGNWSLATLTTSLVCQLQQQRRHCWAVQMHWMMTMSVGTSLARFLVGLTNYCYCYSLKMIAHHLDFVLVVSAVAPRDANKNI